MRLHRLFSRIAVVAAFVALALPGIAGDSNSGTAEIALGQIPRYGDESTAQAACAPDGVVWADSKTGFFYPRFHDAYGKTPHGVFTCYSQAKKADYWSLTPDSDWGHKGREFPLIFCDACT